MDRTVAVIDGNSWVHRAYHAVPPVMSLADGTPTNAVHGFMNMFLSFYDKAQPDAIIVAFDAGIPKFRLEAVEQYKAQRKPMDNELRVQFPIIEELLKAMDIPVIKIDGWEGDDILGTIAKKCETCGCNTLLVTGDKDINQLASDKTKIVTSKNEFVGPAEVEEKYGIRVDQFIDFLALMGDSVDNIPGVPGIGPKSALQLLNDFNDLEGIYDNLDKLKGKQKENIENNKDAAYISRKAATIATDVPLDLDLDGVVFPSFDKDKVTECFIKYRLKSSLANVLKIVGEELDDSISFSEKKESSLKPPAHIANFEHYTDSISFDNVAIAIDHKIMPPKQASIFDTEVEEDSDIIVAISDGDKVAVYEGEEVLDELSKHKMIVENSKDVFEILYEKRYDIDVFDISLAAYVLDSSMSKYSAVDVYQQLYGEMLPTLDADIDKKDSKYIDKKNNNLKLRLARRAALTYALYKPICDLLDGDKVFYDIEKPLTPVLSELEHNGVKINTEKMSKLSVSTKETLEHLKTEIYNLAGEEFNIDSPKQLAHILFEVLDLPAKKKNKTGYSTDASVLEDLSNLHDLPKKVLEYREYAKIRSTYIEALPNLIADDGLIHTTFHQRKTTTGRLSSSDPNIQNIPTRSEFGNQIRECFIPLNDNDVFLSADYSQIELRLLAHLSEDEGLIEAFKSGTDFHSTTASSIFNVDEPTKAQRSAAKAVNFGIIYGQQAYGLSQALKIDVSEAKEIIDRYFTTYPRVKAYLDKVVDDAKRLGYAETMFGRRRYIPELQGSKRLQAFGERTAMNHPMQGSAADIIKLAMRAAIDVPAKCMMQVHDELDFSCPKDKVDEVSLRVKDIMENIVALEVPLVVDVEVGGNWADAK
ncbi:MAG: DNA polymerase I [Coriobacteriia bacterium]|nr:DNA polymerase I [Coriobacteriia bacterium]